MERYSKSHNLWAKANSLILNGVQTLSKSPLYISPEGAPIYVERASGAYFWDCDGNRYVDFPLALGPVVLGYAYEEVDAAVRGQMAKGILYSLSNSLELELAELLCDVIPSAEKVKIMKSGSDAVSAAIRISRAYTGREMVAACGYHGWHDWTAVRTTRDAGIPASMRGLIKEFGYNDISSLQRIFDEHSGKIAAVVMEPVGMYAPENDFLERVSSLAKQNGALLVFDEIITGFRMDVGGAQAFFSVTPDISAFGKAMANGYPISAVVGRRGIMDAVEEKVFISSTYGGELLSISAAIKTIHVLREKKVSAHLLKLGLMLKDGLNKTAVDCGINAVCEGMPHKTFLVFGDDKGIAGKVIETRFREQCLLRGVFLGYGHFTSYSHTEEDILESINIAREVFTILRRTIDGGNAHTLLKGSVATDVFKRY